MEPFNIRLKCNSDEITLTILPGKPNIYKVIYYGGVLGAIRFDHDEWTLIPRDQLEAGNLPFYEQGKEGEHIEIDLTEYIVEQIGKEIEEYMEARDVS